MNDIDWKKRAEEAVASGYPAGNAWERQLALHLQRNFPNLAKEFQAAGQLREYLMVRTNEAMDRADLLERQGASPEAARELALSELLESPPEYPEPWEEEGAEQDIMATVSKRLSSLSPPSRRPTTRPTPAPRTSTTPTARSPQAV